MAEHRLEARTCPQCLQNKTYPSRNKYCSRECQRKAFKGDAPGHGETPEIIQKEFSVLKALDKGMDTLETICDFTNQTPKAVREELDLLKAKGYNIVLRGGSLELSSDFAPSRGVSQIIHNVDDFYSTTRKIGALGDNHLGSNHERLDVLNALYDIYEKEGVEDVYNTGNWIEGVSRLNKHDIKVHGWGDQIDYFVEKYPTRKGITTHFVAGDDHEGWVQRDTRIEIGKFAESEARRAGRTDLHYLGYVEADILLKAPHGERLMKVMHPGGGSAYATSYAMQKLVESFQGGEKPEILLAGHYHKFEYLHYRGVHIVQTACTVDQSIFMRKNKITAHVGGTLLTFNQAPDGAINRFGVEFFPFYNRGYYGKPREWGLNGK